MKASACVLIECKQDVFRNSPISFAYMFSAGLTSHRSFWGWDEVVTFQSGISSIFLPSPRMVSNALSSSFLLQQVENLFRSSSKSTISSVVIPAMPAPGQHHQGKPVYLTWAPTANIEVISGHAAIQTSLHVRVKAVLCLSHWINILKFRCPQVSIFFPVFLQYLPQQHSCSSMMFSGMVPKQIRSYKSVTICVTH